MRAKTTILLTRPLQSAKAFADRLRDAGIAVVISPVLTIRPTKPIAAPDTDATLIFTSANALRIAEQAFGLNGRDLYLVGDASATLARSFGATILGVGQDVEALGAKIQQDHPANALQHLRGKHVAGDLEQALKRAGLNASSTVIYEQAETPLTEAAVAVLRSDRPVILPVFSPRSAAILSAQMLDVQPNAPILLISISASVAEAWAGPAPQANYVAATPDADAMLKEIRDCAAHFG